MSANNAVWRMSAEQLAAIRETVACGYGSLAVNQLVAELDAVTAERDAARMDAARWYALKGHAYAASFADEQFPGDVVLKFAFPPDTRVSANLDATIDAASHATPEAPRVA